MKTNQMTGDPHLGPNAIRILVVDDHPVVRNGLVAMLGTQLDFHVVGEAGSGVEALEIIRTDQPDVILLDLEMPDLDGLETLEQLRRDHLYAGVIVFTAFDTDERIVSAIQAGAKGYLLKGSPREQIFQAIRTVSQGGTTLQPIVASKLMRHIASEAGADLDPAPFETLTPRETEVLGHLAQGRTNKEIAEALVITVRTVKFHVSSILGKLGAGNRTEAVTLASQYGLIKL
jgi:DNA-binding NarL/FixJ family response regulator